MNWKPIVSAILVTTTATAQTVYHLPFASSGNTIELIVANASSVEATGVNVSIQSAPAWLQFAQTEQKIRAIAAGEEQLAVFVFAVDKSASIGEEHRLQFRISTKEGQHWTKEMAIAVAAPETFELFQNYPNPFNPSTSISYQLPVNAHVSLKIFNLLGQEVTTLVEGVQASGYHQALWHASRQATGIYLYQITATSDLYRFSSRKAMLLLR